MKYILIFLMAALVFMTACGNQEESEVTIENLSDVEKATSETGVVEEVQCDEDEVNVDEECLLIDPYGVLDEDVEYEAVELVEEPVEIETNTKTFEITADNYDFYIDGVVNPEIRVKLNDTIIIKLTSIEGSHSWNVRQLAARSKTMSTNESTILEFVASTAGIYEYYCAVGRHQNIGQEGTFIVE